MLMTLRFQRVLLSVSAPASRFPQEVTYKDVFTNVLYNICGRYSRVTEF